MGLYIGFQLPNWTYLFRAPLINLFSLLHKQGGGGDARYLKQQSFQYQLWNFSWFYEV